MQNFVSIVTLSAEDNAKSSKLLGEGFKRPIYWNKYKVIDNRAVEIADADEKKYIREQLDSSYQGVKKLFVLAYNYQVLLKNIFFQELKQKITTSKLMEKTFMISQLMTQLSNMMKSEKHQQDKVMITQLVVYWILLILKKITD